MRPVTDSIPCVRPPWPDELPRLADAFPGLNFPQPVHLRILVVPGTSVSPERIVGVAALTEPAGVGGDGVLRFAVRSRQAAMDAARNLLDAILDVARQKALTAVVTPAPSLATDRRFACLRDAGFAPSADPGIWRIMLQG